MLLFVFAGELFKFRAKTPALEVLFQLPPRWKANIAVIRGTAPRPLVKLSRRSAIMRQAGRMILPTIKFDNIIRPARFRKILSSRPAFCRFHLFFAPQTHIAVC